MLSRQFLPRLPHNLVGFRRSQKLDHRRRLTTERLVLQSPAIFIIRNHGTILEAWVQLKNATAFPEDISSVDCRLGAAFETILNTIREGGIIARMAHVHLLDVFSKLESLISFERRLGLQTTDRNAKIAVDTFIAMIGPEKWPRNRVKELRRTARRWKSLAGDSVFSLMVYSEMAERTIRHFGRVDGSNLNRIAAFTMRTTKSDVWEVLKGFESITDDITKGRTNFDREEIRKFVVERLVLQGLASL